MVVFILVISIILGRIKAFDVTILLKDDKYKEDVGTFLFIKPSASPL